MRGAALASIALVVVLAGCMGPRQEDAWEPYDDGRGLAFGMLLTVLLIVGVVLLIVNLTQGRQSPAPPTVLEPMAPPPAGAGGWEPVDAPAPVAPRKPAARAARPAAKPAAKSASKSSKPRRPAP